MTCSTFDTSRTFHVHQFALCILLGLIPSSLRGQQTPAESEQFFEQKVRPVLVQHCYACHSAEADQKKKLKGGLFLDFAEGLLAGGDSGPAIVKGKSAESLLIKALNYDGLEMPPTGKLPADVVADLAKWVDLGAHDPRKGQFPAKPVRVIDLAEGRKFWSFQPLTLASPPEVKNVAWARTPIDRFIAAKQESLGLQPNGPVAKQKLIRRAYFDVIGLPPTPEQVDAFLQDDSPQAFEKLVDTLLQSEHYGERWGRHWLDVVRFAESGGYEFDNFRPGAYHYRDWVIKSFNADLPYNEFIRMQLAGEKLQPGYVGASASGFLVAGPYPGQITAKTVERIRYDQLDDMLMTVGGSMLGLTLGCVRCHDHKYDPIPQQDYYALAATFAQTAHGPVTLDPDPTATQRALEQHGRDHETRLAARKEFAAKELPARFAKWQKEALPKLEIEPRWHILDALSVKSEGTWLNTADDGVVMFVGPRRKDGDKYAVTSQTFQQKLTAIRLDALTHKSLPKKGPGLSDDGSFALGDFKVTAKPLDPESKETPVVLKLKPVAAAFEEAAQPLKNAVDDNPGTFWRANADGGKDNAAIFEIEGGIPGFSSGTLLTFELKLTDAGLGRFRIAVSTEAGTPTWAGEMVTQHLGEIKGILAAHKNAVPDALQEPLVRWFSKFDEQARAVTLAVEEHARAKPRPPLADVYSTVAGGQDVFLLRRGEVDNKQGKAVPGALQVLTRQADAPPPAASAASAAKPPEIDPRVSLANWMTDIDQGAGPLLARIIVNRLWQHHLGEGIVVTPNDFGAQGERPTHPELLDWLAAELIKGGWKLKPIHKQIMLSAAYQQGNEVSPENLKIDPSNRFLWHFKPQRLEAEIIRDSLLSVGGTLDSSMYGPSILDNTPRRSVYLRVKRSELIPFMAIFDAPEPTQSIGARVGTTVPTQALTMMNSPFVRQQAEKLATRIKPSGDKTLEGAIDSAYRIAFARLPSASERQRMLAFVEAQKVALDGAPANEDKALVELCQVLLCLNEFVYVD
jgi:Protein of unknown function (DUF1553)/Protein of unknown function (DUF1549)/Planctomycete cytochrome C